MKLVLFPVIGFLARDFVTGDFTCEEYLQTVAKEAADYNDFHLVLLDLNLKYCIFFGVICNRYDVTNYY